MHAAREEILRLLANPSDDATLDDISPVYAGESQTRPGRYCQMDDFTPLAKERHRCYRWDCSLYQPGFIVSCNQDSGINISNWADSI